MAQQKRGLHTVILGTFCRPPSLIPYSDITFPLTNGITASQSLSTVVGTLTKGKRNADFTQTTRRFVVVVARCSRRSTIQTHALRRSEGSSASSPTHCKLAVECWPSPGPRGCAACGWSNNKAIVFIINHHRTHALRSSEGFFAPSPRARGSIGSTSKFSMAVVHLNVLMKTCLPGRAGACKGKECAVPGEKRADPTHCELAVECSAAVIVGTEVVYGMALVFSIRSLTIHRCSSTTYM